MPAGITRDTEISRNSDLFNQTTEEFQRTSKGFAKIKGEEAARLLCYGEILLKRRLSANEF